jgi:hypothetical protein
MYFSLIPAHERRVVDRDRERSHFPNPDPFIGTREYLSGLFSTVKFFIANELGGLLLLCANAAKKGPPEGGPFGPA